MKIFGPCRVPFLLICSSIIVISCARLPLVESHWHAEVMKGGNNFSNYDSHSNLRYLVSNDSTLLYVSFDTDNPGIQRNILVNGARVYVDTNNKKKGTAYLKFPVMDFKSRTNRGPSDRRNDNTSKEDPNGAAASRMKSMPSKAVFFSNNEQYAFDNKVDKTDFETVMLFDSLRVLYYMVGIPFNEINPKGLSGISELSVGIEIEGSYASSGMENMRMSGGGRSGGGRQGGGMPGGQSGGGGRPGGSGERQMPGMQNAEPVKIWTSVQLSQMPK